MDNKKKRPFLDFRIKEIVRFEDNIIKDTDLSSEEVQRKIDETVLLAMRDAEAYVNGNVKPKIAKRRHKPIISNNFKGGGIISLLGGNRGKYIEHSSFDFNKAPKTILPPVVKRKRKRKIVDHSNPLTLVIPPTPQAGTMSVYSPEYNKGQLKITYAPGEGISGQKISVTAGIIDANGNKRDVKTVTDNKGGTFFIDFNLQPGENLFTDTPDGADAETSATK